MALKVMADNGIEISAKQDGALYNVALSDQDFIIQGLGNEFSMSHTGLVVTIETGEAVLHGRHVTANESNTISLPANSSGYLVLRIDLTKPLGEEALFFATPTLTHEEINWTGTIYDMPIATFVTQTIDVSNFEDVRVIKDNPYGEIEEEISELKSDIVHKLTKVQSCFYSIPRWLRFDPTNRRGLVIKAGTSIKLENGEYFNFETDTHINLSSYLGTAGANYNVYLANNGTVSAYTSTRTDKGVKIGRFSTLCANVGTITMEMPAKTSSGLSSGGKILVKQYNETTDKDFYDFYNKTISSVTIQTYYDVVKCSHPLNGFVAGDILPESVFCLSFFPTNKYEDGQVYDSDTGSVIDIYLQSGDGDSTRSIYNATHRVSRQQINHQEDMRMVGKKLLTDHEFTSCAIGSNERTNIKGSNDKGTVGGHVDTSNRRMVSAIGCEECCGYLGQWLDEIGFNGQSDWTIYDGHATFGRTYGLPYVLSAGGYWSSGSDCGSRSRRCDGSRSRVDGAFGGRGSSHLQVGI